MSNEKPTSVQVGQRWNADCWGRECSVTSVYRDGICKDPMHLREPHFHWSDGGWDQLRRIEGPNADERIVFLGYAPSYSVPREPVGVRAGQRRQGVERVWTVESVHGKDCGNSACWGTQNEQAHVHWQGAAYGDGCPQWDALTTVVTMPILPDTPSTTPAVPAAKEAAKAYEGPHLCGLLCYATGCPFGRINAPSVEQQTQGRALAAELKAMQDTMARAAAVMANPRICVPASPPNPQKRDLREVSHNGRDWVSYDSLTDGDAFEAYHYRRVNGVLDRSALLAFAEARWPRIVGNYQECYDVGKTIHSYDKYGGASLSSFERLKPWRPSVDDVDLLSDV